jgi:hypothetical protein
VHRAAVDNYPKDWRGSGAAAPVFGTVSGAAG